MAVVEPGDVDAFLAICAKWDVEAVVIGEVTDGDRLADRLARRARRRRPAAVGGARRPDVPAPVRAARLAGRRSRPTRAEALPRPRDRRRAARRPCCGWSASPNLCDKSWITDQYDRYVQGNTVLAQPSDSGMIRVDEETNLGVAVATDCNGRFAQLDPYAGAQLALAESYRNVATGGATPLAISRLPQLRLARGPRRDVAVRRGLPRPQGRLPRARHPGHRRQRQPLQPDRRDRDPADAGGRGARRDRRRHPAYADRLRRPTGERVLLLGETREELSGSEWAHVVHGHLGGLPPQVDLRAERALAELLVEAAGRAVTRPTTSPTAAWRRRWSSPACAHGVGVRVALEGDPFVALFSESAGRVVVTRPPPSDAERLVELAAEHGVPVTALGVTGGDALVVERAVRASGSASCARPGRPPSPPRSPEPCPVSSPRTPLRWRRRCPATSTPAPTCGC